MNESSDEIRSGRSSNMLLIGGVVVLILIIIGISLPPISIWSRFGGNVESETAATTEIEGAMNGGAIPGKITVAVTDPATSVNVTSTADTSGVGPLPTHLTQQGEVYLMSHEGAANPAGRAAIALPATENTEALDLYGWDGAAWQFIPSQVDRANNQLVSAERPLPQALALVTSAPPVVRTIGAEAAPDHELPVELLPNLTQVSAGTLILAGTGELQGEAMPIATGGYEQYLHVTNKTVAVDTNAVATLLNDSNSQANHINDLVSKATAGGFQGINLDYQGINPAQKEAFSTFVSDLATALHGQNLKLMVTLDTPNVVNETWDSGGQDWATIGTIADTVNVQTPLDPTTYTDGGLAEQLIDWATRQIAREKINLLVTANAIDNLGDSYIELSNEQALTQFGQLQFVQGSDEVDPDTTIEVTLSGTTSPLEWDGASLTYRYSYDQAGQAHTVWLSNEAALAHRLRLASRYNVAGVTVSGLSNVDNGTGYATALQSYLGTVAAPQPSGAAIAWTVRDEAGSVLASASGDSLNFIWSGSPNPGTYSVNADFALGDNVATLDSVDVTVQGGRGEVAASQTEEVVTEEATEETTEETTEEGTEEAAEETTEAATPEPTSEPIVASASGEAKAVVSTNANVRLGPGITYGIIAGGLNTGAEVTLIGRSEDYLWLQVIMPDGEQEGWIFASLLTVDTAFRVSSLPVPEIDDPVAAAPAGGGGGSPAPPPVAAPPVANAGFELGGQTHTFANPSLMSLAGMNWVKFQHKWGSGDSPEAVRGRIDQAHANGFKVLLSIPGANTYPSSIDFGGYIEFLRGVAALGPDAIEVWNEQNIDFEWPAGQIDPASYVNNMLAPAYNAIKSANPNVMVISGAPAPTGFFGGGCAANGCDDNAYLAGMAAAGAGNYMDCVGAHYNAGATPPGASSGHPAGGTHYSWYFVPTMDLYYNSFGKPVCFTELGYLSGEDFGGVPGRFSWAGNTTVNQHAQWLGEAVSIAGNSGKVRMVIIFNVDFTQWGDDPQAGFALMRPNGGCPACATLAAAMGR